MLSADDIIELGEIKGVAAVAPGSALQELRLLKASTALANKNEEIDTAIPARA